MKRWSLAIVVLLMTGMIAPALATDVGRYSYITVERVDIDVINDKATVEVTYSIDEGIKFLVLLIGKSDLRNKLQMITNFENAEFQRIEMNRAVLVVDDASLDYGDGSYWFPEHEFGIVLPFLSVSTPQTTKEFSTTKMFPNGIGHFEVS